MAKGETYEEFVNKFKDKKTTDDCYTPPKLYVAVRDWAVNKYNLQGMNIKRPFYPGSDYQKEEYAENDVVIDNPPFSILSQIITWYNDHGVKYFLFAPTLTLFSASATRCNVVVVGKTLAFNNGAKINISFVTNLGEDKVLLSKSLLDCIENAQGREDKMVRYAYPCNLISAALLSKYVKCLSEDMAINKCHFIRELDAQRAKGKQIYGGGYLISDEDAEKLKHLYSTSKESCIHWELSERERRIIEELNKKEDELED